MEASGVLYKERDRACPLCVAFFWFHGSVIPSKGVIDDFHGRGVGRCVDVDGVDDAPWSSCYDQVLRWVRVGCPRKMGYSRLRR